LNFPGGIPIAARMSQSNRISYAFMAGLLLLVAGMHMMVPLITVLFAFFALNRLSFGRRWVGVILFCVLLVGVSQGFYFFARQAFVAIPKIASESIPRIIDYAESMGLVLPFSDTKSLRTIVMTRMQDQFAQLNQLAGIGHYVRIAAVETVSIIIGIVVAISLFLTRKLDLGSYPGASEDNLYTAIGVSIVERFRTFYESFSTVMGAQLVISVINTALTSVFLIWNDYPHLGVVIVLTFILGLLPILGNLLSNTLIIGVGFTVSHQTALFALLFLMGIHKLEYFLNSKIIGDRIRNPMWLTLLGLVLGERLMGIPGMILAPVFLHYIKVETSKLKAEQERAATG
jgi:predicted PurR-regulated permease PerM